MPGTFKLTDGVKTADFTTASKWGVVDRIEGIGAPPAQGPRAVRFRLFTDASSADVMERRKREVSDLLVQAERRSRDMAWYGRSGWREVNLVYAASGATVDSYLDVLGGGVSHGIMGEDQAYISDFQKRQWVDVEVDAKPFWHLATACQALNLVQNGQFDWWSGCPLNWTAAVRAGATAETSPSLVKYGRYSMRVFQASVGIGIPVMYQDIPGTSSHHPYRLDWSSSGSVTAGIQSGSPVETTYGAYSSTLTDFHLDASPIAGSIRVSFYLTGGSGTTAWVDGVQLTPTTASPRFFVSTAKVRGVDDGSAGHWADFSVEGVPGTRPALTELRLENLGGSPMGRLYFGLRSAGSPSAGSYILDCQGTAGTDMAGSQFTALDLAPATWTDTCKLVIPIDATHEGRFYPLARVYDSANEPGTLRLRWAASMFGESYYGDAQSFDLKMQWALVFLGEMPLSPTTTNTRFAAPSNSASVTVQFYRTVGTCSALLDYFALLPGEQAFSVGFNSTIASGNAAIVDGITRDPHPPAYGVNSGLQITTLGDATGEPLTLEPGKQNRIFVFRTQRKDMLQPLSDPWETTEITSVRVMPQYDTPVDTV